MSHSPIPRLDLVLPCYNPPKGWQEAINEFYQTFSADFQIRIIVVDDGTTSEKISETALKVTAPHMLITLQKNRGKGFALRAGVSASDAPFIVYTDIDIPFTSGSMRAIMDKVSSGEFDVVAGYRDARYYASRMTPGRRVLSKSFRLFMRRVLGVTLDDTQCGLKAFNGKGRELFLSTKIDRYLFDFEFIYRALKQPGLRVGSVQVQLKENIHFSRMPLPVLWRESYNLLRVILFSRR